MGLDIRAGKPASVAQEIREAVWAYMDSTGLRGVFVKVLGDTALVERFGGVLQVTALEGDRFTIAYTGAALPATAAGRSEVGRAEMADLLLDWIHGDDGPVTGGAGEDAPEGGVAGALLRAAPLAAAGLAALLAYGGARRLTRPGPGRG